MVQQATPTMQSAACQEVGSACKCSVDWAILTDESGTYQAAGTAISLASTSVASTSQIGGVHVLKVESKGKANRRVRIGLSG